MVLDDVATVVEIDPRMSAGDDRVGDDDVVLLGVPDGDVGSARRGRCDRKPRARRRGGDAPIGDLPAEGRHPGDIGGGELRRHEARVGGNAGRSRDRRGRVGGEKQARLEALRFQYLLDVVVAEDEEGATAERDGVAELDGNGVEGLDSLAPDERPVGAAEVLDHPRIVAPQDLGVQAGHGLPVGHQVATSRVAPEPDTRRLVEDVDH